MRGDDVHVSVSCVDARGVFVFPGEILARVVS